MGIWKRKFNSTAETHIDFTLDNSGGIKASFDWRKNRSPLNVSLTEKKSITRAVLENAMAVAFRMP